MIGDLTVLAIIPARGGSKGLPGKNIACVGGRPLLAWTVDAAKQSAHIDRVVLSSDSDEIIAAATSCGCEAPFRRPAALATDAATSIEVVLDALGRLPRHDLVVLLQPTSPLRTAADVDAAIARCVESSAPSCVSVSAVEQSPYWMYTLDDAAHLRPLLSDAPPRSRRQDLPTVYFLNGAVYVARCDWLRATRTFVGTGSVALTMPTERALDIDTASDLEAFRRVVEASADACSQSPSHN